MHLRSPLEWKGPTLRNRLVLPPMASGRALADGTATERNAEYHRVRSGAVGLVIVEHAFVHPLGRYAGDQLGVQDDGKIEGLARIAAAIRGEGAVACLQLAHAGSRTTPEVLGCPPVGPSAVPHPYGPVEIVPEALTADGIDAVVEAFGAAATRAVQAGFQAVEVHAAHGYLLSQFLSPLTNHRDDAYGGDPDRRAALHRRVLAEVRRRVGPDFPVLLRLGGADDTPGGLTLDLTCRVVPGLVAAGADLLDVSGGLQGARPQNDVQGYFVHYAEAVRECAGVPVLTTGGIRDAAVADEIVRHGRADLVGVGRAMLADPDWARRALASVGGE